MTAPKPYLCHDRVRWADVDLVGIMRYSAFTRLIELAEQEMMRAAGLPYANVMDAPTLWMPRRQLHIEYFAPVRIDDEVALVTYISRIGDTSMTFNVDVRHRARWTLVAACEVVTVCVSVERFEKQPLPQPMREAWSAFALTVEQARDWRPDRA
jgi:YbgC/YbaW family acyl-CoA thioester hydrolase